MAHPDGPGSIGSADEAQGLRPSGDDPLREPIVLIKLGDPEAKPVLYACGKCGAIHSPRIYACRDDLAQATARQAAIDCYACKEHNVCACGAECPKHWTACDTCRLAKKLNAAVEVVDNGGPYFGFGDDQMFHEMEEAADAGHEWVCPCTEVYPSIDADSILENLTSEMCEDASVDDLDGVDALCAAIDAFNKAQTTRTYWADEKRKIRVPASAIEARQGGGGEAGSIHESAVRDSGDAQ